MAFFGRVFSSYRTKLLLTTNIINSYKMSSNNNVVNRWSAYYYYCSLPSYMNAAVFWKPNKPLTIQQLHMPRPKHGEVLIKTKACGVCHSDLHTMKGRNSMPCPSVLGHEITGEIVQHGPLTDPKTIQRLPIGARVVAAFIMPCGHCSYCSKGHDDLCRDYFTHNAANGTLYDGQTRLFLRNDGKAVFMKCMGGLAEYCVCPANGVSVLPKSLPYAESSILGCAVLTAYGAMAHAAKLRPGDSIAIIGIGGVGSSCVQIARAFGASQIIAVDVEDDKLAKANTIGATHTINAGKQDVAKKIREITEGMGVDIGVEALGRPETFMQCTQSVKDGGKAVIIGIAEDGCVGHLQLNRLVRRKIQVVGSYGGRPRQDLPKLIKLAESGIFNLTDMVSRKYKFEDLNQAYQDIDQRKIIGRAIIEIY